MFDGFIKDLASFIMRIIVIWLKACKFVIFQDFETFLILLNNVGRR